MYIAKYVLKRALHRFAIAAASARSCVDNGPSREFAGPHFQRMLLRSIRQGDGVYRAGARTSAS